MLAHTRRRCGLPGFSLLLALLGLTGCGEILGGACTAELRGNLTVQVRDSVTGSPAALGASGFAEHNASGDVAELYSVDSLHLIGNWSRERAGRYTVVVQKPGTRTKSTSVTVREDGCHVQTAHVVVNLSANPAAVPISPLAFYPGQHVGGFPASVGVQVSGDTLIIAGRAYAACSELVPIAYRTPYSWHVQVQPAQWDRSCQGTQFLQQFELRYALPRGNTQLLVTQGAGGPVELFEGTVNAP